MRRTYFLIPAVALSTALLLTGCGAGNTASTGSATAAAAASPSTAATAKAAPATTAPATPAAPAATVGETQALVSAKQYLAMGSGFSQAGLLQQLTSSSGEGFAPADAQWAIAHCGADWNAQAVDAAKGYMQMGGFSRASLIQQLSSASGDQFTPAQAAYAATAVGLN